VSAGVSAGRIKTISYGKEKPFCMESNEKTVGSRTAAAISFIKSSWFYLFRGGEIRP